MRSPREFRLPHENSVDKGMFAALNRERRAGIVRRFDLLPTLETRCRKCNSPASLNSRLQPSF
ncbi:hypothetical protein C6T71_10350 [Burkholderia multivorans]|nr:hypothetical protein C6T71_10350 [Burkholderia multivorans]